MPVVGKVHKARRGLLALKGNKARPVRKDLRAPRVHRARRVTLVLGAKLGRPGPKAFRGLRVPLAPSGHKAPKE